MQRSFKLKFDEPVEELINYHQNQEKKDKRSKIFLLFIYISMFIETGILFGELPDANHIGIIISIAVAGIVTIRSLNELFKPSFKTSIIKELYHLKKNKKILKTTYDAGEKIVTYSYDEEGVVKHRHFTIDKVLARTDIDMDTVYIGKEFVYAKKWKS